jgi:hypothetical protein
MLCTETEECFQKFTKTHCGETLPLPARRCPSAHDMSSVLLLFVLFLLQLGLFAILFIGESTERIGL